MKVALQFDEKRPHEADLPKNPRRAAAPPPLPGLNPETTDMAILTAEATLCGRPVQAILLGAIHPICLGAS